MNVMVITVLALGVEEVHQKTTNQPSVFAQRTYHSTISVRTQAAPSYRPPESFNFSTVCKSYTEQFDIWSLGCVPSA